MQLHQIPGYIQNIFLAEYEHGCLLLDGASRADFDVIQSYFKEHLKRPFSDLKVVLVTHVHPDHSGCAHKLRKATGCKIYTGTFDKQWYSGLLGYFAYLTDIVLAHWVASRLNKPKKSLFYPRFINADLMLAHGQAIPEFPDWRVLDTPGHTDRDISLVNATEKTIYVADLVVKVKKQFKSPFPVYLPEQYVASVKSLCAFTGYQLLMAHVPSVKLNEDLIKQVIKNAPTLPQTNVTALKRKVFQLKQRTSE